jgi:hypothetical protein
LGASHLEKKEEKQGRTAGNTNTCSMRFDKGMVTTERKAKGNME